MLTYASVVDKIVNVKEQKKKPQNKTKTPAVTFMSLSPRKMFSQEVKLKEA